LNAAAPPADLAERPPPLIAPFLDADDDAKMRLRSALFPLPEAALSLSALA
jgi:hypothetical protein